MKRLEKVMENPLEKTCERLKIAADMTFFNEMTRKSHGKSAVEEA
jgi:hypothetical protein